MTYPMQLPELFKIVDASACPVTTNGGVTFDSVSLKNVHKAWIVAKFRQAVGHATTITPKIGATVATATNAITFSARWWKNADVSASDTLVAQTAGTTMACSVGAANQIIVIEIDPADVKAQSTTYDCLGGSIATSAQASNFVDVTYYLLERYQQATPPAAITD